MVAAMLLSVSIGPANISIGKMVEMLLYKVGISHDTSGWQLAEELIVFQIRLPRVLAGALVGAALSTAGVLFQGLFRNPMADPYVIGTASGAAFGAALAMVSEWSLLRPFSVPWGP
jgi:iron complex transport system permease protein